MLKRLMILILSLAMLLSVVGCNQQTTPPPANQPREERVVRIDESDLGYPSVYTVSTRGRGYLLTSFLFDTLTWKDDKGVVPLLAKEWKASDDKLTWTFTLADKATFTDGKPLTAEDVKFSFDYIKEHPWTWVSVDMVKEVQVVDPTHVKITLKDAYAPFLTEVAGNVPIMPKHIWQNVKEPAKFNTADAVIGSGPFTLANYDKTNGSYTFAANPKYFLGAPVVDKLILSTVAKPAAALQNGELDAAQKVSVSDVEQLTKDGKYKVLSGPGFWIYRLYFNYDRPELNQTALRQAMFYAINRPEMVAKAAGGQGVTGNPGHIHPDSEWYSKDVKQYDYNPETAKSLLDKSGMKDTDGDGIREYQGKALKYELLVVSDRTKEAEMVKSYLTAVGIGVTVKAQDQKTVDGLISEGKFELAMNGHGSFGGDPVLLARFATGSSVGATPGITAQGGKAWVNEQYNALYAQQIRELDQSKRYQQVAEMQKIIADELPTLSLYYTLNTFAYNPAKLNGWFYTKDGVARAVPTLQNKLVYVRGTWGGK